MRKPSLGLSLGISKTRDLSALRAPEPPSFQEKAWLDYILKEGLSDEELRENLVEAISEIDQIKRKIREDIHATSNRAKANRTTVDQDWLHRANAKIDHLQRQREKIRSVLGDVNARMREFRRRTQGLTSRDVSEFFMVAARELLDEETFERILDLAASRAARSVRCNPVCHRGR